MASLNISSEHMHGSTTTITLDVQDFVEAAEKLTGSFVRLTIDQLSTGAGDLSGPYLQAVRNWLDTDGSEPLVATRSSGRVDTFTFVA